MKRTPFIWLFSLLLCTNALNAQNLNNWQRKSVALQSDTIQLDSLSLISGSLMLYTRLGKQINDSLYLVNHGNSSIILVTGLDSFKKMVGDTITAEYRTFTIDLSKRYYHKDIHVLEPSEKGMINPFMYTHKPKGGDLFLSNGLNKSGSISRGVTIGNNQDLSVNSNLDLQISGKLNERVRILAAITDRNIPIQPDGTTVQIQEFDRAYIQLYDDNSRLTVGDFRIEEKTDHFMTFLKKARGGIFETTTQGDKIFKKDTSGVYQSRISGAISKGKFSRYEVMGKEGIQGPYKVQGANNEQFIVVLSGTERIFIDGELMKRGQDHDYIINYNTAEITFTAKRMITKDKRIVVEFQYSDRNYVRSMINVGSEYKTDNFKIGVKYYSEQDNKNQPLQQDLTDPQKILIAEAGDALQDAIINSMVEVPFSNNEVLYRLVDTLGYVDVLVYLDNKSDSAYRATFSNVGSGNGDYIQANTSANGKVFQWVEPVLGVSQGSYAPKMILAAPGKKQLVALNTEFNVSKRTKAIINLARSENDVNLFSTKDKGNDDGYAIHVKLLNERKMFKDTSEFPWKLKTHVSFEQLEKNFTSIERFRTVEFQRDWNLQDNIFSQHQYLGEAVVNLSKKEKGDFLYKFNSFSESGKYDIFKNDFISDFKSNGYRIDFKGSYLKTDAKNLIRDNTFLRLKSHISKSTRKFTIGMKEEYEKNKFMDGSSIANDSYEFIAWEGYLSNSDSADNNYEINYKRRLDKGVVDGSLLNATLGQHVGFSTAINKNKNSIIKSTTEYRRLTIKRDNIGINQADQADNTLVNRIEYLVKLGKGLVSARSFYEIGSGLEVKKEFQYIEVQAGQGVYVWDDDDDGIQELDEFREAKQKSQAANFIKVFTPTTDYIKTSNNQFNQSIYIKPSMIWRNDKKGIQKVLAKLSTQTTFRVDRKSTNEAIVDAYNPFHKSTIDTNLISENYSLRNILFINKGHAKIGGDIHANETRNKIVLMNGFDERKDELIGVNIRWNMSKKLSLNGKYDIGVKRNSSEFFVDKDYQIKYGKVVSKFSYQPTSSYRISLLCNYQDKANKMGSEQTAIIKELGSEFKFNSVTKGSLLAEVKFIMIDYEDKSGAPNTTSVSYEMLESFQNGNNITWMLPFQKKLANNMQLSISYDGRYSESANVVHTGGAQVRAFF